MTGKLSGNTTEATGLAARSRESTSVRVVPALTAALPPSRDVLHYAQAAEQLGYERVWLFDSPPLYGDMWMAVGRVAEGTGLGVGAAVAVPSLRHPMVTASAIATVEDLAPGRLITVFGTGFTARRMMGQRPMRWSDVASYVRQVRGLLTGAVVNIDGHQCQMVHPPGWAPERPIRADLWVAPFGPKGFATARELEVDGVLVGEIPDDGKRPAKQVGLVVGGTVIRPGEDHSSTRVIEAAGPWYASGSFHAPWDLQPEALDTIPGGPQWRAALLEARPECERHLAVHEGHMTILTKRDRNAVRAAGPAILNAGWTGDGASIAARVERAAALGVDYIVYEPAGPDIPAELAAFAAAARDVRP